MWSLLNFNLLIFSCFVSLLGDELPLWIAQAHKGQFINLSIYQNKKMRASEVLNRSQTISVKNKKCKIYLQTKCVPTRPEVSNVELCEKVTILCDKICIYSKNMLKKIGIIFIPEKYILYG